MTTPIGPSRRANTASGSGMRRREWWRSALTAALVLAGAAAAIVLSVGTSGPWAAALTSLAGFAAAITVIAAVETSWEHLVVNARNAGLVEFPRPKNC